MLCTAGLLFAVDHEAAADAATAVPATATPATATESTTSRPPLSMAPAAIDLGDASTPVTTTAAERRWVMPMRLPTTRPTAAIAELFPSRSLSGQQSQLSAIFSWDQLLPAGVAERAVAAIQALTDCEYKVYWRQGALCRLHSAGALLLELKELSGGGVRLSVDARGDGAECWAALTRLCPKLRALLMESFPGLLVRSHLACPACLRRGEWEKPTRWPLLPLLQLAERSAARCYCMACGVDVELSTPTAML